MPAALRACGFLNLSFLILRRVLLFMSEPPASNDTELANAYGNFLLAVTREQNYVR